MTCPDSVNLGKRYSLRCSAPKRIPYYKYPYSRSDSLNVDVWGKGDLGSDNAIRKYLWIHARFLKILAREMDATDLDV